MPNGHRDDGQNSQPDETLGTAPAPVPNDAPPNIDDIEQPADYLRPESSEDVPHVDVPAPPDIEDISEYDVDEVNAPVFEPHIPGGLSTEQDAENLREPSRWRRRSKHQGPPVPDIDGAGDEPDSDLNIGSGVSPKADPSALVIRDEELELPEEETDEEDEIDFIDATNRAGLKGLKKKLPSSFSFRNRKQPDEESRRVEDEDGPPSPPSVVGEDSGHESTAIDDWAQYGFDIPEEEKSRSTSRKEKAEQRLAELKSKKFNKKAMKSARGPKMQRAKKVERKERKATRKAEKAADKEAARLSGEDSPKKTNRAEKKKLKEQHALIKSLHPPSKGKSRVVVLDGRHVSVFEFKNGELLNVGEQDYASKLVAAATAARQKANYYIWANRAEDRTLVHGAQPDSPKLLVADTLNRSMGDTLPYSTMVSSEQGMAIASEWVRHQIISKHRAKLVFSGLAHGVQPGIWLRIGHEIAEISLVDEHGYPAAWSILPFSETNPTANDSEGSGLQSLSDQIAQGADTNQVIDQYVRRVTQFVLDTLMEWHAAHAVSHNIYVWGPGATIPNLFESLETHCPNYRVAAPPLALPEDFPKRDQADLAMNVWGRPTLMHPQKIIRREATSAMLKRLRQWISVLAVVSGIIGFQIWRGNNFDTEITAMKAETEDHTTEAAQLLSHQPPPPELTVEGARQWFNCPNEASAIQTSDVSLVAVPVDYDPANWPIDWHQTLLSLPAFDRQIGASVISGTSGIDQLNDELEKAKNVARAFRDGSLGENTIAQGFEDAGIEPERWKKFMWTQIGFTSFDQQFLPPATAHICAATGPDLLWVAQNSQMLSGLVSRQIQEIRIPDPVTGGTGWNTLPIQFTPPVPLTQQHSVFSTDLTIFGAWLVDEGDIADALRPLAIALWGIQGEVKISESPIRSCRTGVDPERPEDGVVKKCATTVGVLLGPGHLLDLENFNLLLPVVEEGDEQ